MEFRQLTAADLPLIATWLARPHVALMEMGGRTMAGWITVAPEGLKTKRELAGWVKRSVAFAKTLPPK